MPVKRTVKRAAKTTRKGKAQTTRAGVLVREEMSHMKRRRKPRAASRKQAIAIGLSKARRAGIRLPAARKKTAA